MQSACTLLRARGAHMRELVRHAVRRLAGAWRAAGAAPHGMPQVLHEAAAILMAHTDYVFAHESARMLAASAHRGARAMVGDIEVRRGVTIESLVAAADNPDDALRDALVLQIVDNNGHLRDVLALALAGHDASVGAFDAALPGARELLVSGAASPTFDPVRLCLLAGEHSPVDVTATPALLVAALCLLGDTQLLNFCCHVLGGDVSPYAAPAADADPRAGRRKPRAHRLAVLRRRRPVPGEIYITDILRHLSRHAVACGAAGCTGDADFGALVYAFAYFAIVARSPQRRPTAIYGDIWAAVDRLAGQCLCGTLPTQLCPDESAADPLDATLFFAALADSMPGAGDAPAPKTASLKRPRPGRYSTCTPGHTDSSSDDDDAE